MGDERPRLGWSDLRRARVGVWGLGREGGASLRKLRAIGVEPVLVDDAPKPGDEPGILTTAGGGLDALAACEIVIKTPGISRYGQATIPMDEARAACAIDVSGRGLLVFAGQLPPGAIDNFDHELVEEFMRALATNARLTLHLTIEAGGNVHHMIEAAFKALARALRAATAIDPSENGVPSTKGTLT